MAIEENKLTVLSDHYKDTNQRQDQNIKVRDRYFFLTLFGLAIMAFQLFSPEQSSNLLTQVIKAKLETEAVPSLTYISSIVWFGLLAVIIKYFQAVINIEKQYTYIHSLEDQLAKNFSGKAFTREGKAYLTNYAVFSDALHSFYRYIFPASLVIAATIKITSEWKSNTPITLPLFFNSAIYGMIVIGIGLYVSSLHKTPKAD